MLGARCSVVWDWGDFWRFFAAVPDVEIIDSLPATVEMRVRHYPMHVDPCRELDITVRSVELHSGEVFWAQGESRIGLADVRPYLPELNSRLQAVVDEFVHQRLQGTVGFHMRRTDNKNSMMHSPDSLFVERAREIIASGKKIFVATDNPITESQMYRWFGSAIVTYPKRQMLPQRWPRAFDPVAAEDDLLDLFLLARTEYVLGSYWSSFSGVAIALNGSEKSEILKNSGRPGVQGKAGESC
jgi:hypothetical protein